MTSNAPIEFYFDFSSPYGYLGSKLIGEIAARHGREVLWRPFLLGAIFKITGGKPLVNMEMKGDYARHDMERTARFLGIPFHWNPIFPFASISAARAVYWREMEAGPQAAGVLASALYQAAFAEPRDITKTEIVADVAAECGCDRADALAA
ncbi:MAG: DsbA family protein, partial [Pseudomonadota bacterium]